MLTALGVVMLIVLGVPSAFCLGAIMVMIGGSVVPASSPAWWRFLVGFGAFMLAGLMLNQLGLDGMDNASSSRLGL